MQQVLHGGLMYTITLYKYDEDAVAHGHADELTHVLLTTPNEDTAYASAVGEWLEEFEPDSVKDQELVAEFKKLADSKKRNRDYYRKLHEFFKENSTKFWKPSPYNEFDYYISVKESPRENITHGWVNDVIDGKLEEVIDLIGENS
jgi:hypothetical protein